VVKLNTLDDHEDCRRRQQREDTRDGEPVLAPDHPRHPPPRNPL